MNDENKQSVQFLTKIGIVLSILTIILILMIRIYSCKKYSHLEKSNLFLVSGEISKYKNIEGEIEDDVSFKLKDYPCQFYISENYLGYIDYDIFLREIEENKNCKFYILPDEIQKLHKESPVEIQEASINEKNFLNYDDIKDENIFGKADLVFLIPIFCLIFFGYYHKHWNKVKMDI